MGFGLQGKYSTTTSVLDVREGQFVASTPTHPYFLEGYDAQIASQFLEVKFYNDLETITLNGQQRKKNFRAFSIISKLAL